MTQSTGAASDEDMPEAEENQISDDADAQDISAEAMYSVYSAAADEVPVEEHDEAPAEIAEEPAAEYVTLEAVTEEPAPEEPAPEESAPDESGEEAPAAEESVRGQTFMSPGPAENAAEESTDEAAECTHKRVFGDSYHTVSEYLINKAGRKEYFDWEDSVRKSSKDPCAVNIRAFIEHFGITEDVFSEYLVTTDDAYFFDYPIDILYGDAQACESYYSAGGQSEKMTADLFEYRLKVKLTEEIGEEEYNAWLEKFPYKTVRAWSISEFVTDHGIPEPRFLEIYRDAADAFMKENDLEEIHEYDTVKIYVNALGIKMALASSQLGYYADVSCRK